MRLLVIKTTFFFFLFSFQTSHLSAQIHSGNTNNKKKNEYHQTYEKAKFYQNRTDSTLKIIQLLRDELSSETRTEEKVLLGKRILNLEQQQAEYQKNADLYLEKAKELKNNIDLKNQRERLEEISVYSDPFYKLPPISNLLRAEEWQALYSLEPFYSEGTKLMHEIAKLEKEKNQLVILTNTPQHQGENEKIKSRIEDLSNKIKMKENEAFLNFQKVYEGKYKINSGIINRIVRDTEQEKQRIIINYKDNAARSYKKSFELLKDGENTSNKEKKFKLLGESNTYALLAVETQKKAIGTYTGTFSENISGMNTVFPGTPTNTVKEPDVSVVPEKVEKKPENTYDTLKLVKQFKVTSPENTENYTIPVDKSLPSGIIYKIQIGVYQKIPSKAFFKGIWPITAEAIPSSQNLRFLAGVFSSYKDALNATDTVHSLGFKDAFIISYIDQKKIPVKEARKLENNRMSQKKTETVSKVLVSIDKKQPADLHEDIFLTVQIGAFHNKIPEKRMDLIRLYAENEPVTFFINKKGLYVYTIGKFYNFEKTVALKNRLIENGLEGAYVIALSGNQKIRLDDAIQILSGKY